MPCCNNGTTAGLRLRYSFSRGPVEEFKIQHTYLVDGLSRGECCRLEWKWTSVK